MHHHNQQQAQRVNQNMALTPLDLFPRIVTPWATNRNRFDRLTLDDGGAGFRSTALRLAHLASQRGMETFPGAIEMPKPEVMLDRFPGG